MNHQTEHVKCVKPSNASTFEACRNDGRDTFEPGDIVSVYDRVNRTIVTCRVVDHAYTDGVYIAYVVPAGWGDTVTFTDVDTGAQITEPSEDWAWAITRGVYADTYYGSDIPDAWGLLEAECG